MPTVARLPTQILATSTPQPVIGKIIERSVNVRQTPSTKAKVLTTLKKDNQIALVARNEAGPDSDVDFLVTFEKEAHWSFFDMVDMQDELKDILGREVDLVERLAVERSENYIRRRHILQSLEPVYVAG